MICSSLIFYLKVIYEKYIQNIVSRICSICLIDFTHTSSSSLAIKLWHRLTSINQRYVFTNVFPSIIINLRYVLVFIFLIMGILG